MYSNKFNAYIRNSKNNKKAKQAGFSLVELLVGVVIVGILSAVALPTLSKQQVKAKQSEAAGQIGAATSLAPLAYQENEGTVSASDFELPADNTTLYNYQLEWSDPVATIVATPSTKDPSLSTTPAIRGCVNVLTGVRDLAKPGSNPNCT